MAGWLSVPATGLAPTSAQLVERGVTRNREQPGPRGAPAMVQTIPRTVQALERQRRHILGRGPVAEQRYRIRVHVGSAFPKERLDALPVQTTGPRRHSSDNQAA